MCFRGVAVCFASSTKCSPGDKTFRAYDSGRHLVRYTCMHLGMGLNIREWYGYIRQMWNADKAVKRVCLELFESIRYEL